MQFTVKVNLFFYFLSSINRIAHTSITFFHRPKPSYLGISFIMHFCIVYMERLFCSKGFTTMFTFWHYQLPPLTVIYQPLQHDSLF
jgi:hypothetical protein